MRYTQEQISTALVLLKATGSPDEVIRTLGYPSNPMLYHWRKKYPEYYDVPIQKHWKQASIELKTKYSLPVLFKKPNLSKSSYYYQEKVIRAGDKYRSLRKRIIEL